MSTSHSPKPTKPAKTAKRSLIGPKPGKPESKAVRWLLDRDGDLYGDEQERLTWYEGTVAAASVQWIVLPWTLAVMAWLCSRSAAIWVLVLLVAYALPTSIASGFVMNRGVRMPTMKNRKMFIGSMLMGAPLIVALAGLAIRFGKAAADATGPERGASGGFQGALFGGFIGLIAGYGVRRAYAKKQRARANAVEDLD